MATYQKEIYCVNKCKVTKLFCAEVKVSNPGRWTQDTELTGKASGGQWGPLDGPMLGAG